MYLRLRKLETAELKPGDVSIMVATELSIKGNISMHPARLEWWDGLEWHQVKIVEKDADNRSPYS